MRDSLQTLTLRCERMLKGAYMADRRLATCRNIAGWKGYPVRLYEYHTGVDVRIGTPKTGRVYLLNPSPRKLARWIANASWRATGGLDYRHTQRLIEWIGGQSGGQFPVAGVVYEAMERAGEYYPYLFRDGVTVYLRDSTLKATDEHCTDAQLDRYLHLSDSDLQPYTGRYARISSTTREQYTEAGGTDAVGTSTSRSTRSIAWLNTVRRLYQQAWRSDRNLLIEAWAKANLHPIE